MYVKHFHHFWNSRSPDEKKFKSMEKTRPTKVEMAQKKDEAKKKSAAAEKEVGLRLFTPGSFGGMG